MACFLIVCISEEELYSKSSRASWGALFLVFQNECGSSGPASKSINLLGSFFIISLGFPSIVRVVFYYTGTGLAAVNYFATIMVILALRSEPVY